MGKNRDMGNSHGLMEANIKENFHRTSFPEGGDMCGQMDEAMKVSGLWAK